MTNEDRAKVAFIEWLRPWVKAKFGKWITHNTAKGAYEEYRRAASALAKVQEQNRKAGE